MKTNTLASHSAGKKRKKRVLSGRERVCHASMSPAGGSKISRKKKREEAMQRGGGGKKTQPSRPIACLSSGELKRMMRKKGMGEGKRFA